MIHSDSERLAAFIQRASYADLSEAARLQIKIRMLDAIGCAIGAVEGEPVRLVKEQIEDFGGTGHCTLIGGGRTSPDRAALYNGALIRYLDFNDSYLAKGETCHPSDNIGPVFAASEYAGISGRDFMTALAVAYQVQCRLSDVAPVREKGFDHVVQGSYAVAAGVSKALGLDSARTTNAIGICGTAFNALRVTRTGILSHWKGLAYPNTSFCCTHAAFLAMRGITGPVEVFEGNKGFMDALAGRFEIDWEQEDLERVTRTILKKYNAEVHSQSVLEGIIDLKQAFDLKAEEIESIEIEIFDVSFHIIGGGEEGDKTIVLTKEQADHSLPYMVAVALLDGEVMPRQYRLERIQQQDVQTLLRKVIVKPSREFSLRFPEKVPCRITLRLSDGRKFEKQKEEYEGFYTRPMSWERVAQKFDSLSESYLEQAQRREIEKAILNLETVQVADLARLLEKVQNPPAPKPKEVELP